MARSNYKQSFKQKAKTQKNGSKKKKKPAPYRMHDDYFHKAKKEGYRARSVYKLKEIQEKFELITPDMDVCDV